MPAQSASHPAAPAQNLDAGDSTPLSCDSDTQSTPAAATLSPHLPAYSAAEMPHAGQHRHDTTSFSPTTPAAAASCCPDAGQSHPPAKIRCCPTATPAPAPTLRIRAAGTKRTAAGCGFPPHLAGSAAASATPSTRDCLLRIADPHTPPHCWWCPDRCQRNNDHSQFNLGLRNDAGVVTVRQFRQIGLHHFPAPRS